MSTTRGWGLGRSAVPAARLGLFGGRWRSQADGIDQLRAWIASTQGLDAVGVVDALRRTREEAQATWEQLGIYAFRYQLEDAAAYRTRLDSLRIEIEDLARAGLAVSSAQDWTVNGPEHEARKTARNFSKLVLRAYNAEADHAVRTMKPHRLASHVDRLCKSRQTIARLGASKHICISDAYHDARVRELYLTADFLQKKQEEEIQQEDRAREYQEAVVQGDTDREWEKPQLEQGQY